MPASRGTARGAWATDMGLGSFRAAAFAGVTTQGGPSTKRRQAHLPATQSLKVMFSSDPSVMNAVSPLFQNTNDSSLLA